MRKLITILFLFACVGLTAQTFYFPVYVKKTFRTDGRVAFGMTEFTEDFNITADTILILNLDGTGNLLTIDVDGNVLRGTGAGTGGVSGLNPNEVLFGAADGTIDQDADFLYDESSNDILLGNGVSSATFNPTGVSLSGATTGAGLFEDHLQFSTGANDLFIYRTTGGSDYTLYLPNAQGAASTFLKNDGAGNLSWSAETYAGTVTSFTFTDGNGFDGTVTDATTTPTLSLTTSITDNYLMLSNSGAISGDANLQWNGTALFIAGTDAITVNGAALTTNASINSDGTTTESTLELHKHSATGGAGASIFGARSRGTSGSPTIVNDNDHLLSLTAVGHDNTDYATSSQIVFEVDGTPGNNDMPGQIVFLTSADGTQSLTERMRIRPTGSIEIEGVVSEYNNIATANNGVASSVGTPVNLTAQSTDILATTAYTADEDGFYQVCWSATVTTAATSSSILGPFQVQFTNASDDVVKLFPTSAINFYNQTNANTTGAAIGGVMTVYAASGTAIKYLMGHTSSGATTMVFDINITIVKL